MEGGELPVVGVASKSSSAEMKRVMTSITYYNEIRETLRPALHFTP